MFIRRKKLGERTLVQIVESYRHEGKPRQRVRKHVGTAYGEEQTVSLERHAQILMRDLVKNTARQPTLFHEADCADLIEQKQRAAGTPPDPSGVDAMDIVHHRQVSIGVREAFGAVLSGFGWDRLFGSRHRGANRVIRELAIARIAQPLSKRATVREWRKHGDTLPPTLNMIYKAMDRIDDEKIEEIVERSLFAAKDLLQGPPAAIFYDVTTLHFESEFEDDLRSKGFSKNGKHNRVQVLFALLVTPQGLPVGYELFPGNTCEGSTLVRSLEALEKRHGDARFTVVADAAMISKKNEAALQERETPCILGARLKSGPADLKEKITDLDGCREWKFREHSETIGSYRSIDLDGERRMVVTHSPKRARKDKHDRDKALDKLRKRLRKGEGPASFSSRGAGRFLKFPDGKVEIDDESVKEDAKWDGLRGIVAWGCGKDDPREPVAQYRRLAEIESCFRTNKHDMKIRPIFHWKEKRVRAHIAICYMAFCCVQHLRVRLDRAGCRMSADRIRLALNEMEICIMREKSGGKLFAYPTAASDDAKKIYSLLGLNWIAQPFIYVTPKDRRSKRKKS